MDKTKLLDRLGAVGDERLLLAKVLDRAGRTQNQNIPVSTDFLSPGEQVRAADLLRLAGISGYVAAGGYEGAERRLFVFLPDWQEPEDAAPPVRFLRAAYRAEDSVNHRDLLGSLMGLGIVREKVGDILMGEARADLIVMDTVADFLLQNWTSAGRTRLKVSEIEASGLQPPEIRCREIRDTVSALRLDAVAASGFRTSRGKAAELIAAGRVQVNWRECTKPDKLLSEGDTVSARGLGKFRLSSVGGTTRKGRVSVVIQIYI